MTGRGCKFWNIFFLFSIFSTLQRHFLSPCLFHHFNKPLRADPRRTRARLRRPRRSSPKTAAAPLMPTISSSQCSLPWSLQKPMALETSPPVKSARWRQQAAVSGDFWEGSKRRLQWRQVRQEGVAEDELGVKEEASASSKEDRSSDRGGQTRHRLGLCFLEWKERREVEARGGANWRREPATTQRIGKQRETGSPGFEWWRCGRLAAEEGEKPTPLCFSLFRRRHLSSSHEIANGFLSCCHVLPFALCSPSRVLVG